MALDAVEQTADNREVQQQFQAEILAACRLNGVRQGGAATATDSGAASDVVAPRAMQMMSELPYISHISPMYLPYISQMSELSALNLTLTLNPNPNPNPHRHPNPNPNPNPNTNP